MPFLANGAAIYGGASNCIEDCRFTDIPAGSAILISTTFPTADARNHLDNNFSGTTVVQDCDLFRSQKAALQFCLNRRSISGVVIRNLDIKDSFTDGISIIEPGGKAGGITLSNTRMENVTLANYGMGGKGGHGLWILSEARGSVTITKSKILEYKNDSPSFKINWE